MPDDVIPTPGGDTQVAEQPGTETPQVTPTPTDVQTATVPERTYTHKEWQERETARDKEVAEYRQAMAQQALGSQMEQMRSAEAQARAEDAKLVDSAQITEADAQRRMQQRHQHWQQQIDAQEQGALTKQQLAVAQQVLQEAEKMGRIRAAEDLAKEHGLDPKDLLHDAAIKNYDQMEAKALRLALKAQKVGETFDSGQMSGSGQGSMSSEAKLAYGLSKLK